MGRIRRWMSALYIIFILVILSCVPIGSSALGVEIATRQTTKATITNVRVGTNTNKTRVVLDISRPIDFRYHISVDGTAVFIDLPRIEWTAPPFELRHSKGKIIEFRYSPKTNGGRFNILTDGPVSIKKPFFVKPEGRRGHRIVIDIVPSNDPEQLKVKRDTSRRLLGQKLGLLY